MRRGDPARSAARAADARRGRGAGLLALLLLTDARRAARVDAGGALVSLEDQDRGAVGRGGIAEGRALIGWPRPGRT